MRLESLYEKIPLYLLHVKAQQAKKKVLTKNKLWQPLDPKLPRLQNYEN